MILEECKKYIESNIEIFKKTKIEPESYKGLVRKAMELDLIANFICPHIDEIYEEVVGIADTVKYSRYTSVSKGMYYPSVFYKTCTTNLNLPKRLLNTPPAGKEYCIYYYRNNELLLVEYKFLERSSALCCFVIKSKEREYAVSAYSQGFLDNVHVCEEIFDDCKLLQYTEFKTVIEKNACEDCGISTRKQVFTNETVEFYKYDKNGKIYSVDLFNHFVPYRKSLLNIGDRFVFEFNESGKPIGASRIEVEGEPLFYRASDQNERLALFLLEGELRENPKLSFPDLLLTDNKPEN